MKKTAEFIKNALWLSASALLLRSLSVGFNSYIAERIGSEGMGLFSMIMGIYAFALTLASAGISLSSTRMVAEELGLSRRAHALGALSAVLRYALLCGGLATAALLLLAPPLSRYVLGDVRTLPALSVLALGLLPVSVTAALNGYFTAVRRVYKNAAAAILEQSVRMTATVLLLLRLLPCGVHFACLALALGGTLSEILSLLFSLVLFLFDRRRHFRGVRKSTEGMLLRTLKIALPIAISSYVRSGLSTVQYLLVPSALMRGGLTRGEALAAVGVLHGMVLPVLLFPTAVVGSFAGLLVPEVAECHARDDRAGARRIAVRALSAGLIFSIGTAGLMALLSGDLSTLLYSSSTAGYYLLLLAPAIPVMYLDSIVDALLKGLGHQVYSMGVNIADAAISILLLLLFLPRYGISGYVAVIYITEIFNFALSLFRLCTALRPALSPALTLFFPLGAALFSFGTAARIFTAEGTLFSLLPKAGYYLGLYLLLLCILEPVVRVRGKKERPRRKVADRP